MNYQLLVEGLDRVGKTTLINEWCKRHPEYLRRRAMKHDGLANSFDYYFTWMEVLHKYDGNVIWDRAHISEGVYTSIYRPQNCNEIWPDKLYEWDSYHAYQSQPVIIYVPVTNRSIMLPDDEHPNKDMNTEIATFERILSKTYLPVIRLPLADQNGWLDIAHCITQLEQKLTEVK